MWGVMLERTAYAPWALCHFFIFLFLPPYFMFMCSPLAYDRPVRTFYINTSMAAAPRRSLPCLQGVVKINLLL